ncbi:MAG TPA: RNA polymerase sigma factor RpoD, partial [Macromonas sp.]|nr:RNA polymerase sigma factor RpoD [Macromonas sp.]
MFEPHVSTASALGPWQKASYVSTKKPTAKSKAAAELPENDTLAAEAAPKKKTTRSKAAGTDADTQAAKPAAKRGRKPKADAKKTDAEFDDADLSDIEEDMGGEPEVVEVSEQPVEKVKPLRMKISKAKERALMKEFGLDDTVLTEEESKLRRERLKTLIKLGKTRG